MPSIRPSDPQPFAARWIYRPSIDLIVGCGAWSIPLLLLAGGGALPTRAWAVIFYLLALAFNYPHYMATVYRAYHTRTEFARYRVFTLHITVLLGLVAFASHMWAALVPWIFTAYITWSPWHYTAQNFGLAMMFARRNGVAPTERERRRLFFAFLASYALLFISFHTGPSTDPLIRSLGIPTAIAAPAQVVLLVLVGALGLITVVRLVVRAGPAAMLAPFILVVTQASWFVVPALAGVISGAPTTQTRYSTGVLAVMHSAQYLWITSYYARREAESSTAGTWRPWAYAATLVGGGIALFVPWPWMASYLFRTDFTQSVLIVTAIVNIHHFVLDGALWKLRDRRIAALLVDSGQRAAAGAAEATEAVGHALSSRAFRVAALLVLVGWAGVDQVRFVLGTSDSSEWSLAQAAALNPYDSSVQRRTARLLIEQHRYEESYALYRRYLLAYPQDGEALLNTGVLAVELGREDEAVQQWEAALQGEPAGATARRYLGQLWGVRAERLDQAGRTVDAARAFQQALTVDEQGDDAAALGVDWFNYGQFLRRHEVDPHLVLACLLQADELLAWSRDGRLEKVRAAREAAEREQPAAAAAVRQSLTLTEALVAARARYSVEPSPPAPRPRE